MTSTHDLAEVASLIRRFVRGDVRPWEWDDFISVRNENSEVETVRQEVMGIPDRFPSASPERWCSEAGLAELQRIATRVCAQITPNINGA
jgi:hypothetical protein